MKRLTEDEINALADKYKELKGKVDLSEEDKVKFKEYQNYCIAKLQFLVDRKAYKYKRFPNYLDLRQDGLEAMLSAFKTYNSKKGNFSYWAGQYIKTKISRCANAHSTIKFPIKKAAELKPYKVSSIPIIIDGSPDGFDSFHTSENKEIVLKAIDGLPKTHKNIVLKMYGFVGKKPSSMVSIMDEMSLSRPQFLKILNEAKEKIKKTISAKD